MYDQNPPATRIDSPTTPPQVYRARHDPDGPANLSTTVAHALAECMGVDVTDGTFSLYDSVDPDALDALFRPKHDGTPRRDGLLSFFVAGHEVFVYGDGQIVIEPPV